LRPLALSELTPKRLYVGQTLSFMLKKTDEQNRAVRLSATGLPENATFDVNTGRFNYAPHSGKRAKSSPSTSAQWVRRRAREAGGRSLIRWRTPTSYLTAPTAATPLVAGQYVTVSWATDPGVRLNRFQVKLSTDGGATYNMQLTEAPGNVGQYRWMIPAQLSCHAARALYGHGD
jgi:hypothetical protein